TDVVDLVAQTLTSRRYAQTANVPILHRKEEFLHRADPRWEQFRTITQAEVEAGLYSDTSRIGYRDQWNELVRAAGGLPQIADFP
ncbi:MAG: hypothetical protein RLZ94_2308, partial [Actinomycetota bacterium]